MLLNDLIKELTKSKGYVIFTARIKPAEKEGDQPTLQFEYSRQHYPIADLEQAFQQFRDALGKDLKDSAESLSRSAEQILRSEGLQETPPESELER